MRTGAQPLVPPSDKGMFTCHCHSQLTALTGDTAPAATDAEVPQDQSPAGTQTGTVMDPEVAADIAILRGECSTLLYTSNKLFLGLLSAKEREIQTLREAAAANPKDYPHIERPAKIKNLQAAMSLKNDDRTYTHFCMGFLFIFQSIL